MAAADQLAGLLGLLNSVNGSKTTTKTSGGTTTSQQNVSDAGVNELLNQILSGSGGVKSIGSRARSSGLYNSTTEDSLLSELYTTAANKAELARTPTVTTTSGTTQTSSTPGVGVGGLATGLGGAFLASQALNLGAQVLGPTVSSASSSLGSALSDLLGLSGGSDGSSTGTGKGIFDNINIDTGGSFGRNIAGSGTNISTGEGYGIDTSSLGNFGGGSNGVPGAKGLNFGFDLDSGAGSVGIGGLGALGGLLGSALGGIVGNSGGSGGGGGGTSGGTTGGSIICTALMGRGLLNAAHYAAGDKYIQSVPIEVKVGYYAWAESIAEKIHTGNNFWTRVCLPFAVGRTALLASNGSITDHLLHPLGSLTKFVGEPICGIIGTVIIHKEIFKNLQGV